jgi:(p)ppGpp synthase/HD superfamily hydrolase
MDRRILMNQETRIPVATMGKSVSVRDWLATQSEDERAVLAERIARKLYENSYGPGDEAWITHHEQVVGRLAGQPVEVRAAAWIHDVPEHTNQSVKDLTGQGVSPVIADAVMALAYHDGQTLKRDASHTPSGIQASSRRRSTGTKRNCGSPACIEAS